MADLAVNEPLPELGLNTNDLVLDILGEKFIVATDEEPEYLNEILAQYKLMVANTQNISKIDKPIRIAILTGFLLCDELNKLRKQIKTEMTSMEAQHSSENQKLEHSIQKIISRLDQVINENTC